MKGREFIRYKEYVDSNPHLVFTSLAQGTYGNKLGRKGMSRMLRKYEAELGRGKRITYHMFRHSFGTLLLKK